MWSGRPNGRLVAEVTDLSPGRAGGPAGAAVEWVCGDALRTPFPTGSFDVVSMQYPALPKAAGEDAVRRLLDTVHPGGLLLAVTTTSTTSTEST
ncbi:MAG TPA: class I SAM-dependent methyltransferase [Acidimicrobiales bacterium]|nr:class I SAM-dependent methyltransferase [Acidimicrobiales bacterium]